MAFGWKERIKKLVLIAENLDLLIRKILLGRWL
jgi:hypothetical protein